MAQPNVVICGLTAAGKTTHAKLLASELGYRYVSGTATLARMCGLTVTEDPPRWSEIAEAVAEQRTDNVDARLEQKLLRLAREREGQVFDVWALPWTSDDPRLVRMWLDSDVASRTSKCFVSQGDAPMRALHECRDFIGAKDEANRQLFLRTIGFDLFRDHDRFDVVLDNSAFITEPTHAAAVRGIAAFAPIVLGAVQAVLGSRSPQELARMDEACVFGGALRRLRPHQVA